MAKPMLEWELPEQGRKLPPREKHTMLDFARFLAAKREEESDEVVDLEHLTKPRVETLGYSYEVPMHRDCRG